MYHDYITLTRNLLLFTLSILSIGQSVVFCIRILGWRFYNSKNSIPNRLASSFGGSNIEIFIFWFPSFAMAPQSRLLFAAVVARTCLHQSLSCSLSLFILLGKMNKLVEKALEAQFLSSFQSKTKLYGVIPNSKPIRTNKIKHSKIAFLRKNYEDSRDFVNSI